MIKTHGQNGLHILNVSSVTFAVVDKTLLCLVVAQIKFSPINWTLMKLKRGEPITDQMFLSVFLA